MTDIAAVRAVIEQHFPSLWPAVNLGLATCATLLLKDNANPVALIYVGPPSAGKTTVATMFETAVYKGQLICYRSDKFTPAAFVSQSAKANDKQLSRIDLLPRIKHKVLLTPELSTIFRGKQDELVERFSIITRVMDGQGLSIDGGTHGRRNYTGDYLFAWIGCTTPLDSSVWGVMAQLGSRLFFLVMDTVAQPSLEDLIGANVQSVSRPESIQACQEAVKLHLEAVFTEHEGVKGREWKRQDDPREVLDGIARCAQLLSVMRTPVGSSEDEKPQPESAHRANAVLYNLARGHALVHGRTNLIADDLTVIGRVTLSSMPAERRAVLSAFHQTGKKELTVSDVVDATEVSRHRAENIMQQLDRLGIMRFSKEGNGKPAHLSLADDWKWCVEDPFASMLQGSTHLAKIGG